MTCRIQIAPSIIFPISLFLIPYIYVYIKEKIPEGESDLKNRTVILMAYLGSAYIIPFSKHGIV